MNTRNFLPWLVAALSMLFAMIVLIRNEITPAEQAAPQVTPRMTAIYPGESEWRPSNRPPRDTPQAGDYSPWSGQQLPQSPETPQPTPAATPAPTPTPTPTPRPEHDFRGVVLDGDNAVEKAQVRIISGTVNPAERSATTNQEGRFVINNIPDDTLSRVIVEAQGYSVTILENVPLPLPTEMLIGITPLAGIDAVVLDFSSTSTEPILYDGEMQASLMRLKAADEISTLVMGISEPVLPVDSYIPVRDQTVLVNNGELRFDNVEPGRYRVAVRVGQKVAESEPVSVVEGGRSSATLTLGMQHTVRGNVVAEDTARPVAEARVGLAPYHLDALSFDFPDYVSFTDGNGEFVIPEVQPGRYWMVIGAAGYTTKSLEGFTVLPGAPPEDTSVTLTKQEPLITVFVTDQDGRPMTGAPLVLMTAGAESPRTYFGKTDDAGLYRFERLTPGRYTLSITAPTERTRQKTLNVTLGEGEVRELRTSFGRPTAVSGRATAGGRAYKGVLSFLAQGAAVADNLVTTQDDGTFTVELEAGEYMVGTPEQPARISVSIDAVETQTIVVELP